MKSQVLYASVIFSVTALLMSTVMFSADAREIDFQEIIKGNGARINDSGIFQLTVVPIADSKEFNISYGYSIEGETQKVSCIGATDKIVKIASLKKATIVFDTTDEKLGECIGRDVDNKIIPIIKTTISVQIESNPDVEPYEQAFDNKENGCNEDGLCSVTNGSTHTAPDGTATVTIGENESFLIDGSTNDQVEIFKQNTKETYWKKSN